MSERPEGQFLTSTALARFDPIILGFIDDLRVCGEIAESYVELHRGPVLHFLIWSARNGIALGAIDGSVIDRFLQHDCDCWSTVSIPRKGRWLRPWRKRESSPEIMRFVRFLEQTDRIETPEELDENFRLLEDFLGQLCSVGYASRTIRKHRNACSGLIVWLHLSRISLRSLTPKVYERFWARRFICSIPGTFHGRKARLPGSPCDMMIRKFLSYLASIGEIEPLDPPPKAKVLPEILKSFSVWLERNRGICAKTIGDHIRRITEALPDLGNPKGYDATLIRRVLWEQMERRTQDQARMFVTSMRMYLRFLVSEGTIAAALVEAVPTMPRWRLSTLPRYISADEIERTIDSCGNHRAGIRDRAILLLLARLALRAGDVAALRLCDIDWNRAEICVSGKSRRETALPLPQDVGDALHTYITTVRPRLANEQRVFLRAIAPYRPLSSCPGAVSKVARRALERAQVTTFASRGAHVFRHSQATALLRAGATLDVIQSLLRHDSLNTTMIYAKTDVVMLQEVAQPWIGGMEK